MNSETGSSEETKNEQVDSETQRLNEVIQRIKQPPAINEVLKDLPPEEVVSNPVISPEMLQDRGDIRHDLTRDK
jgi:hypothetical protein